MTSGPVTGRPSSLSLGHGPREGAGCLTATGHLICLAAFLERIAEMLRTHFYNQRFASRAPAAKTPSSETARRAPAETACVRLRDPPRGRNVTAAFRGRRRTTLRSSSLQRLVLDGTGPASGQSTSRHVLRDADERGSFFDCFALRRSCPLTLLEAARKRARKRSDVRRRARSGTGPRQCDPLQTLSPTCFAARFFGQLCGTHVSTPHSTFLASYRSQDRKEPFANSECLPSEKSKKSALAGARPRDLYPLADG